MKTTDKLVRSNSALAVTGKSLLTSQERLLISELDLTATNSKTVLEPRLSAEFARVLAEFPAAAIEFAFRSWRDVSPFFPSISDIRERVLVWVRRRSEDAEYERQKQEKLQLEAARSRGELVEFGEIIKKLREISDKIPEPDHIQRLRAMRNETPDLPRNGSKPATKEEFEARREADRKEIADYMKAFE